MVKDLIKKGFTLVELLVVISVIGILLGVSLFGIQGARESARDSKRKADLEFIRSGLELYKADCNLYPVTPYPRTYTTWPGSISGSGTPATCSASNTYLTPPTDPRGASGQYYRYYTLAGATYELCASLEDTSLSAVTCGGSDDCGNGTDCNYKVTNP